MVLFLHGWQSTPGVKPTFLAEHGHDIGKASTVNFDQLLSEL